jgi:hypothetical protein
MVIMLLFDRANGQIQGEGFLNPMFCNFIISYLFIRYIKELKKHRRDVAPG